MKGMNVRMKKKFILIQIIIIFLISYIVEVHAIDATYTRENGNNLVNVATKIEDDLYLDGEYGAYSNLVTGKDVKIYNYESNVEKTYAGMNPSSKKYFDEDPNIYYGQQPWLNDNGSYGLRGMMYFKRQYKI